MLSITIRVIILQDNLIENLSILNAETKKLSFIKLFMVTAFALM